MSQRRRPLIALIAALSVLAAACGSDGGTGTGGATATIPAGADTLVLDAVGGGQIDFGDYAGQDVIFWFWAPW